MSARFSPCLILVGTLLALAACDRGAPPEEASSNAANAAAPEPPPPPPVENAVEARPAPVLTAAERRRAARAARDGPGEARAPEYEGARSAATALPSEGEDQAGPDPAPTSSPPSPSSPQG